MMKLTDETLMLYADGALEGPEQDRVRQLLARDAKARSRLQVFRQTGPDLADLFDRHVQTPVPASLRDFILSQDVGAQRLAQSPARLAASPSRRWWPKPAAGGAGRFAPLLAASMALVFGLGLGWLLRGEMAGGETELGQFIRLDGNRLLARQLLHTALETQPSGPEIAVTAPGSGAARLRIDMTFRNADGGYCRGYELALASPARYAGVACRVNNVWSVEMQAFLPASGAEPGQIAPAGGSRGVMDAAVEALIAGDALGSDDEAATIRRAWSR